MITVGALIANVIIAFVCGAVFGVFTKDDIEKLLERIER